MRDPMTDSQLPSTTNIPPHSIYLEIHSRSSIGSSPKEEPISRGGDDSRTVILVAPNELEKERWLEDLSSAITNVRRAVAVGGGGGGGGGGTLGAQTCRMGIAGGADVTDGRPSDGGQYTSNVELFQITDGLAELSNALKKTELPASLAAGSLQNAVTTNSLVCVCWHRNTSLNFIQYTYILEVCPPIHPSTHPLAIPNIHSPSPSAYLLLLSSSTSIYCGFFVCTHNSYTFSLRLYKFFIE